MPNLQRNHDHPVQTTQAARIACTWLVLVGALHFGMTQAVFAQAPPSGGPEGVGRADAASDPAPVRSMNRSDTPSPIGPDDPAIVTDAVELRARRTSAWTQGPEQALLLEGVVTIRVGTYGFRADAALVRVETQDQPPEQPVHHVRLYLDNARSLNRKATVQAEAPRLVVTVSTSGPIRLSTDLLRRLDAPPDHPLIAEDRRTQRYPQLSVGKQLHLSPYSGRPAGPSAATEARADTDHRAAAADRTRPRAAAAAAAPGTTGPETAAPDTSGPPPEQRPSPTEPAATEAAAATPPGPEDRAPRGTVSFHAEKIIIRDHGPDEVAVLLADGVRILYQDTRHERTLALTAGNGVIFVSRDGLDRLMDRTARAAAVRGVYLEDCVTVSSGPYTIRAPRVYYDPPNDKAVVLDAVLYTWDPKHQIPIYLRAETIRQASRTSWSARNAALTTSEFAVPHFSIAAGRITIEQPPGEPDANAYRFTARDATVRWGPVPFFYWPHLSGEAAQAEGLPLTKVDGGYTRRYGPEVRTSWDLFALLDRQRPQGVVLEGQVDQLGEHGPALGLNLEYDQSRMFGLLDGYLILNDTGKDKLANRRDVEFDGQSRGQVLWRHRQHLRNQWELTLELAHLSDETFLEAFRPERAETDKGYETSLYLVKHQDDQALSFLTQYDLLDFTAQTPALQATGYRVDKLPELAYFRVGTGLWGQRLTYFTESRLSRMRIRVGTDRPRDRGFSPRQSAELFGIPDTTSFDDAAAAAGLPREYLLRADTRHELQAPMRLGAIDLVPYAAGRVTVYDENFSDFAGNDDKLRLWGATGLRLHTQFNRVYDGVDDRVLDLHRLRHVVEPTADISWAASTLDPDDLPVFDPDVEPLSEGFAFRVGATNTLQTERGGEGRWESVDWIVAKTHFVFRGNDADTDTEPAWYFGYRPEYSRGGDHFQGDLTWRISDTFATVAQVTHSLEHGSTSQWRIGASLQHTPDLTSFLDYTDIDPLASRLLSYGFTYRLTSKYDLAFRQRVDLARDESRRVEMRLRRRLPRWLLIITASHDQVDDEQTIGVVLVPEGLASTDTNDPFGPAGGW